MGWNLQVYEDEKCKKPLGKVEIAEWDITKNHEITCYIRNPNSFIHAYFVNPSCSDSRVEFVGPNDIKPKEIVKALIRFKAQAIPDELSPEQESMLFADVMGMITSTIRWRKV